LTLLGVGGIAIRFADTTILDGISFQVGRGERWGVVGRNGIGKTSLFEVITGQLTPAAGVVSRASGLRIAVLDQHRSFGEGDTVWDAAAGAYRELRQLETTLAEQGAAIGAAGDSVSAASLARYSRDLERFEHEGGYTVTARVDAILDGLGFDHAEARVRQVTTLSGGERGRVGLAAQLAAGADLLLLDEPTNHLDLAGIRWLEGHLRETDAAAMVISHDRAFLDTIADHILHLEAGSGVGYDVGYQRFVEQRAERRLAAQRAFEKQAKSIAKEEDYIRRNIAGQNSAQAVGRQRRLRRLPRLSPPPGEQGAMAVRFSPRARGGDQVLVADQVGIELGGRTLLADLTATIRRGEVVGLVGPNGAGKSTLLRVLLGEREPTRGSARLGDSIQAAHYRQDLSDVPAEKTLFDAIHDLRPAWTRGQVHDHLGRIGFSGDTSRRRVASLSGGELARVALGRLMLSSANFLVFDEPTNHLDVETIEALEDAIEEYQGTVLLVSHDRALLRALTTRVWALADGTIEDYPGSFGEWEDAQASRSAVRAAALAQAKAAEQERARRPKPRAEAPPTGPRPLTAARRTRDAAEERVMASEASVAELTKALEDASLYDSGAGARRAADLARALEQAKAELGAALATWEEASVEVERLERDAR
jgi:ATP-binding cassette subfamily F protein 3